MSDISNTSQLTKSESRYLSLDILRGLSALGIMLYHYFGWTLGHFGAGNPLGRFGCIWCFDFLYS
jgi:peptidoglycan/LPS O-acetylase OafA/YrhL